MDTLLEIDRCWTARLRIAEKPGPLRSLAIIFAHSGDSWFWVLLLIIGLVWFWQVEYWRIRLIVMLVSILTAAILVMAIKFTVRRKRPQGDWGSIYRKTDPHSFPSGHAVRAAMLACIVVGMGPAWLGVVLCIWAPLVMLSRVAMGIHYLSDVMAGALLGCLFGSLVFIILQQTSILF